jgi:hypothetical protein
MNGESRRIEGSSARRHAEPAVAATVETIASTEKTKIAMLIMTPRHP